MQPETEQDQQDEILTSRKLMLLPRPEFEALVAKSGIGSSEPTASRGYDPLAQAMENNPTLTRKNAEEMTQRSGSSRDSELKIQWPQP
jgi:hypothetical protein